MRGRRARILLAAAAVAAGVAAGAAAGAVAGPTAGGSSAGGITVIAVLAVAVAAANGYGKAHSP